MMEDLTTEQRCQDLELKFDPIYVNHRKFETVFGDTGRKLVDYLIGGIPSRTPDWLMRPRISHAYSRVALDICSKYGVPTLGGLIASGNISSCLLFCSTEKFKGDPAVYQESRITINWIPDYESEYESSITINTSYITCDTGKYLLEKESSLGVVGQVESIVNSEIRLIPIVMGQPILGLKEGMEPGFDIVWYGDDYFENFIEDIDEFSKIRDFPTDIDWGLMKEIPEAHVKQSICDLLGEQHKKDWGGEMSDIYTADIHLNGRRTTAAFVLKGPSQFSPMTMRHLGKNGDQIYRLSCEPAELLVVQHCHIIDPAVRATLRAFAVQPGNPRRYCLIDGKDTFRLLMAYDMLPDVTKMRS